MKQSKPIDLLRAGHALMKHSFEMKLKHEAHLSRVAQRYNWIASQSKRLPGVG